MITEKDVLRFMYFVITLGFVIMVALTIAESFQVTCQ